MKSDNIIIVLLVSIIILNLYQSNLIQIAKTEGFIAKPSKDITYKYVSNNIKDFYKIIANKNNDVKTEIKKIINIKPIEGFNNSNSYSNSDYIVKYQLNNNTTGTRRFYINRKGNVLAMSAPL